MIQRQIFHFLVTLGAKRTEFVKTEVFPLVLCDFIGPLTSDLSVIWELKDFCHI